MIASLSDQVFVSAADKDIRSYYESRKAPFGLRMKKLHQGSGAAVYEARPNLSMRLLWAESEDMVSFLALGNHDEVRRYLKRL